MTHIITRTALSVPSVSVVKRLVSVHSEGERMIILAALVSMTLNRINKNNWKITFQKIGLAIIVTRIIEWKYYRS
jgi:hypothetical protein